ncbi:aldehyde dehydrogenase (NAD+) [Polaromonas sp. OV174]|uniref:aldehyde dehydrogenase family protein n=1 Tax=Polaromonas sp. OV174 TaxID=1855300 RepID=UPI0008EA4A51|nr:aldehyde dehydrogenase family protein [Polaromonas sp. OV174]SFC70879.1 aldehyde dehydrogenase (NAD+) [Polaromonas sp. OV174]
MSHSSLSALVQEARTTGTLSGLPDGHLINGLRLPSQNGGRMETIDPGTGKAFATFAAGDAADIDAAVAAAQAALTGPWRALTPAQRGRLLLQIATLIRSHGERLAVVESLDSGKTLTEALGDIAGAAATFEYYAGACDKHHGDSIPLGENYLAYTINEPVGVTAHIIPWNYPLSSAARGIAPALAAGCTVVAKPAEQTPLTALMLADICLEAGLPPGVCNVVTGTGRQAGAALVRHPGVHHISFTGSVPTGIDVMQGAAPNVTRLVLELGGKSPVVVLADCDIDAAVSNVLGGIYENAGQICSAGSRLVIDRTIHADFVERLVKRASAMTLGHGLRRPDMGAVNSLPHLEKIAGYVERARARGVSVRCGGQRTSDPETGQGWFYQPTILDQLTPDDEAIREEIFGPVLCVQTFSDLDEAVALANGTDFGLVAGIFTRDFSRAHQLARRIDAGQVYINEYFAGGVSVPFGGNRKSGFGREKGLEALRSYSKLKSVAARISCPEPP